MKTLVFLFCLCWTVQAGTPYSCEIPNVTPATLDAVIRTESAGNPLAISINRPSQTARRLGHQGRAFLVKQPSSKAEAIQWVRELQSKGITVSVGLMQVNVETTRVPVDQLFDPCTNIKIGWARLASLYDDASDKVGEGQRALRMALSAYNSGSFTSASDYASAVARHVR